MILRPLRFFKAGADVNAKDNEGVTPLHLATWKNASAIVEVLLKGGADANAKDNEGRTPLQDAVSEKSAMVEVLLKAGADTNVKDKWPYAVHLATWKNASAMVEVLLKGGADANGGLYAVSGGVEECISDGRGFAQGRCRCQRQRQ